MDSNRWGISTSIRRSRTGTELLTNLSANLGKQCLQGVLNNCRKVGIGESSAAVAARLRVPVMDDLYMFVDTVERGEGSTPAAIEVGYGITNAWDDLVGAIQETASTTVEGVNQRKQDDQDLQRARVNRLFRDRRYHAHTSRLIEGEARASRMAWTLSMDANDAARSRVITLRTQDTAGGDQEVMSNRPQATGTVHTCTDYTEVMLDLDDCSSRTHSDLRGHQSPNTARENGTKKNHQSQPCHYNNHTTTSITDVQLEALIEQGVAKALAARDADRNTNDDDSHVLGTSARRTKRVTRECTYPDFMKCQLLN
nr:hypothetical protein [Tanacetum cinerariifolium]